MSEVNEETLRAREALAGHYKEVLGLLGEDVEREGLLKTPERVAKAMPPCFRKRITNRWLS